MDPAQFFALLCGSSKERKEVADLLNMEVDSNCALGDGTRNSISDCISEVKSGSEQDGER